jgi:hypothetical protein
MAQGNGILGTQSFAVIRMNMDAGAPSLCSSITYV